MTAGREGVIRLGAQLVGRWRLQAALGSLRAPFQPCRVSLEGRPLPEGVWLFRRRGSVLRVGFQAPDRRTSLTVRACA